MKLRLPKILLIMPGLGLAGSLKAAVIVKDPTSTDLNNLTNWTTSSGSATPDPTAISGADQLRFNEWTQASGTFTSNLSANLTVGNITVDSGVENGGTATANMVINSANSSVVTLMGAGHGHYTDAGIVLNSSAGGTLTINSAINIGASQQWVLSRVLTVGGNINVGDKTLTLNTAGKGIMVSATGALTGSGSIVKMGASNANLLGDGRGFTGSFSVTGGILALGLNTASAASSVSVNGGNLALGSIGTTTVNNLSVAASSILYTTYGSNGVRDLVVNQTVDGVIAGNITQDGGRVLSLTKNGSATLTISSASNNQSGATIINAGTLKLGSAVALGTTASGTTVNTGGVLDLNGQTIGAEALTLNGSGISSSGALVNSSATAAALSGNVSLATASSIGGSGDITLSGIVSGDHSLTKVGSGTLTLSGANTYRGGTTINAGTVVVNNAKGLGASSGAVTVNGGTLNLNGQAIGNNIILAGGKLQGATGAYTGAVTATASAAISGTYTSFSSGSNPLAAFDTSGGLIVGTLGGQGIFSGGLVSVTGTHNPGNSPGTQTFANGLSYADSVVVNLEIKADGSLADSLIVQNGLSIGTGVSLNIALFGDGDYTSAFWDSDHSFKLIEVSGGTTGAFASIDNTLGGGVEGSWLITQDESGVTASWTANAIPEPSSVGLLGVGLAGMLLRRRRKQA